MFVPAKYSYLYAITFAYNIAIQVLTVFYYGQTSQSIGIYHIQKKEKNFRNHVNTQEKSATVLTLFDRSAINTYIELNLYLIDTFKRKGGLTAPRGIIRAKSGCSFLVLISTYRLLYYFTKYSYRIFNRTRAKRVLSKVINRYGGQWSQLIIKF